VFCGHGLKLLIVEAKIISSYFNAIGLLNLNDIVAERNFFGIGRLNCLKIA
jgi:hypothetical protein